jgi:hypothetical protein
MCPYFIWQGPNGWYWQQAAYTEPTGPFENVAEAVASLAEFIADGA